MVKYNQEFQKVKKFFIFVFLAILTLIPTSIQNSNIRIISPLAMFQKQDESQTKQYEVFGFAPYWNIHKLNNVSFGVLTTFAYFDIPVDGQGNFATDSPGYQTFISDQSTALFKKAHQNGTRVVITFTQMNNYDIDSLIGNYDASQNFIRNAVSLVKKRGLDGANIDFEYTGNPGNDYRNKFTRVVNELTQKMHREIPGSKITVSVYASSVKDPKIYDIKKLSEITDGIFMMAYDFATASSDNAIPTSPLYGHKSGKYWYDVSTAVEDFLSVMDGKKLILGLPWYGYDYPVDKPEVKAQTYQGYYYYYWYWGRRYQAYAAGPPTQVQTYANAKDNIQPDKTGWDSEGEVGWKAYLENGIWRLVFIDDAKSLKIKYTFAKQKNLGGVGVWALGFDDGKHELWDLLKNEFGIKTPQYTLQNKSINDII